MRCIHLGGGLGGGESARERLPKLRDDFIMWRGSSTAGCRAQLKPREDEESRLAIQLPLWMPELLHMDPRRHCTGSGCVIP
jgi:hypothetical protein